MASESYLNSATPIFAVFRVKLRLLQLTTKLNPLTVNRTVG